MGTPVGWSGSTRPRACCSGAARPGRGVDPRRPRHGRVRRRVRPGLMTGHAFQVFLTDDEVRAQFTAMRRALKPDGGFAFETRNPGARAWERWTPENGTDIVGSEASGCASSTSWRASGRARDDDRDVQQPGLAGTPRRPRHAAVHRRRAPRRAAAGNRVGGGRALRLLGPEPVDRHQPRDHHDRTTRSASGSGAVADDQRAGRPHQRQHGGQAPCAPTPHPAARPVPRRAARDAPQWTAPAGRT